LWAYYHVVKKRDGAPEAKAGATAAKKKVKRKIQKRAAQKKPATKSRQKAKRNGR
jgi:hypothetical protein